MSKTQEALKLALPVIEDYERRFYGGNNSSAGNAIREALAEQPATPFGIGGGLVAIKTLLSRDPCAHAKVAIEMIDAMLAEQPAQQESEAVRAAWMTGYTEGEREAIEKEQQPAQQQEPTLQEQLDDALQSLDFYRRRVQALQQWQSKMRDPERTIVCDIIANGCALEPAGDRYKQPAQQQEPAVWTATRLWNRKDTWTCPADIEKDLLFFDNGKPEFDAARAAIAKATGGAA